MEKRIEASVATLIQQNEYMHHLNEVLGLSTENIFFLKRKFVSGAGFEIVKYDVDRCKKITATKEIPIIKIFFGVLLMCLILGIFYGVYTYWDSLEPGTRVYVGMFCLAFFYSFTWVFGAKRHRVSFTLDDGKVLSWKSSSGDFEMKIHEVNKIIEFAKRKEIFEEVK